MFLLLDESLPLLIRRKNTKFNFSFIAFGLLSAVAEFQESWAHERNSQF